MDVQGAEGDVIKGASKTLQKTRFLYTEYNNNELYEGQPFLKSLLALLQSFKVVTRYPEDVLLKNMKIANRPMPANDPKRAFSPSCLPGCAVTPRSLQCYVNESAVLNFPRAQFIH